MRENRVNYCVTVGERSQISMPLHVATRLRTCMPPHQRESQKTRVFPDATRLRASAAANCVHSLLGIDPGIWLMSPIFLTKAQEEKAASSKCVQSLPDVAHGL